MPCLELHSRPRSSPQQAIYRIKAVYPQDIHPAPLVCTYASTGEDKTRNEIYSSIVKYFTEKYGSIGIQALAL
jgi:hypothetical protein